MTEAKLRELLSSMTTKEKAGQLIQCIAGQFIENKMEATGPEGEKLPTEDLCRVMGSVLTFEDAAQAKALQDMHLEEGSPQDSDSADAGRDPRAENHVSDSAGGGLLL